MSVFELRFNKNLFFFKTKKEKENNGKCFGKKCEDLFYQLTMLAAVGEDNYVAAAASTLKCGFSKSF